MPDRLSLHTPIFVNTIGHCAGAIIFGVLLYLLLLDWRRDPRERSLLPAIAAALALLWNVGSLIGLATPASSARVVDMIVALSFSFLSLLPAVLLHISVGSGRKALWATGYAVSGVAAALHMSDVATGAPRFHYAGILVVTIGFGILTTLSLLLQGSSGARDGASGRLAAGMVLFLLAVSFVHFEPGGGSMPWSGEAALHHAGIPLALFVLLQDYRFLLLDVFIRIIADAVLAAAAVAGAIYSGALTSVMNFRSNPFRAAMFFVGSCIVLTCFALLRARVQRWLTRAVFLRHSAEQAAAALRDSASGDITEPQYLTLACKSIAEFLSVRRYELKDDSPQAERFGSATVIDDDANGYPSWVRAAAPLRLARGDAKLMLLGARAGGRRFLSEDMRALERLLSTAGEQVERIRANEMQNLVAQAELRALEGQINPHFLFNSLNTLYGTIDRENAVARQLVTNLASLFRYALSAGRSFIPLEQEIRIVRAYLEIEQLRLGPKLRTSIDVDEKLLGTDIPVFSIQPLVENAVKHGVAPRREAGFVNVAIRGGESGITVEIENSGAFGSAARKSPGGGIGLANVRKRLSLCYGDGADVKIQSGADFTKVSFVIPVPDGSVVSA